MTLTQTAKLNGIDPMAWRTEVLERIVSGCTKAHELQTLLPWDWAEQIMAETECPATPRWQHSRMVDHPKQVERLMERLSPALPRAARVTPELQNTRKRPRHPKTVRGKPMTALQ